MCLFNDTSNKQISAHSTTGFPVILIPNKLIMNIQFSTVLWKKIHIRFCSVSFLGDNITYIATATESC